MRRLIRDQERTKQGVDAIIGDITKVFPMRNIYGKSQRKKADICIDNPYEILEKKGKKQHYQRTHMDNKEYGDLQHREHFIDFEYHDKSHENGLIVVSEVYKTPHGDLDHVRISKRKHEKDNREKFATMSMKSTQLGIITQLHTLMQLAGMKLKRKVKKSISTYKQANGDKLIIKKRRNKRYKAIQ